MTTSVTESPSVNSPTRRTWAIVLGLSFVLFLIALWAFGALWASLYLPQGSKVAGIDVSGKMPSQAVRLINKQFQPDKTDQILLNMGGRTSNISREDAGIVPDARASVNKLFNGSFSPAGIVKQIWGRGREVPLLVKYDEAGLTKQLDRVRDETAEGLIEGSVVFEDGRAIAVEPVAGKALDVVAAKKILTSSWPGKEVQVPLGPAKPKISAAEVNRTLKEEAPKVVSGPVRVVTGKSVASITPKALAAAATFVPGEGGKLKLKIDGGAIAVSLAGAGTEFFPTLKEAHFDFASGKPVPVAGSAGTDYDMPALGKAVAEAIMGNRKAEAKMIKAQPKMTVAELSKMGVKEIVSEFSTPITPDRIRTGNLVLGAQKITGTVVPSRQIFSLSAALGPVNYETGFRDAGVVNSGMHVNAVGGGLSQVCVTTYNAAFLAGMDDIEHKPHSQYFSRYPMGRECTLWTGVYDLKFRNSTPNAVAVQAWVADGKFHVRLWGTKYWQVTSTTSAPYAQTEPTTQVVHAANCQPSAAGRGGFTVDISRVRSLNGKRVDEQKWKWAYSPINAIQCG